MPCTTILVGKKASFDGSTMIARNDDSGSGHFTAKRFVVVKPEEQPRHYRSVISHVEMDLPDHPQRYTACPNVDPSKGIWAASGINASNVAMTATETITTNARVLGADPLVELEEADKASGRPEKAGGIGEEDLIVLTLPYIHSAREGVQRLGALHEQYGTYETNGVGFADGNEIWWFESVGGHHWIARRVPDEAYVVMPNQLGIDYFDLRDACGEQKDFMCSPDLAAWMKENHLDLTLRGGNAQVTSDADRSGEEPEGVFNPRDAFGSHDDADHVYNTPRAWFMLRTLNPGTAVWDGPNAEYTPQSDDLPWCMIPERKVTVEDVKYVLSSHYQGTPYDPYGSYGDASMRGAYRSIGINRNDFLALLQIRPDVDARFRAVEWIAFASNAFNALAPFYTNVEDTPSYMKDTTLRVSTDSFYWASRLIAALTDASYGKSLNHIEHYEMTVLAKGHETIAKYDRALQRAAADGADESALRALCAKGNEEMAEILKRAADHALDQVLFETSNGMKNSYSRSDH